MGLTDDERYEFDVAGFLVRESVLEAGEVAALREHVDRLLHSPDALPAHERSPIGGPGAVLVDHPRVVDVLHDVIGAEVRLDASHAIWRTRGGAARQGLHQGGWNQADPVMGYRVGHGQIFAGLVRVVFELSDVGDDDGATSFLIGSHKAGFRAPPGHLSLDEGNRSRLFRSYSCPAGSAVFFTENILHAGPEWRRDDPRVAVLNLYGPLVTCWQRPSVPDEVIDALTPERRAWLREPWMLDFTPDGLRMNTTEEFLDRGGNVYRSQR